MTAKNKDRKNVQFLKRRKIYMFAYEGVLRGGEFSSNKKNFHLAGAQKRLFSLFIYEKSVTSIFAI